MALTARKMDTTEECKVPAEVVPMSGARLAGAQEIEELGAPQSPIRDGKRRVSDVVMATKQSLAEVYQKTRQRSIATYTNLFSSSRDLTRRVKVRASQIKQERPLQLLAVIAGAAFVLGIVTRVWRSRQS